MADNTTQFGRVCHLVLGKGGSGIKISELRIRFRVTKSSDGKPNTASIEIYNLKAETQNQIIKEWEDIQLIAGYKGAERLIFSGQIRTAIPKVSGADRILVVEAGDGDKEIYRGFINKTLLSGCTSNEIINECQSAMFGVGIAYKDNLSATYKRGRVLSGRASDVLSAQVLKEDAQWSIQDGQFLLLQGSNVRPNAAWLINDSSGMLGSPEPTTTGVKVKTLLNPAYLIGGLAKIDSIVYNGGVRIELIIHNGDTHANEWYSEIEGLNV